jgi:hypothetical protein
MNSTVILTDINNEKNIIKSIIGMIENDVKPTNLCIIFNNIVEETQWELVKTFFKSCCGAKYTEELKDDAIILNREDHGINFYGIKLNKLFEHELKNYAINYLYNQSDIFIVSKAGSICSNDFISKYIKAFDNKNYGAVYSDYIENNNYRSLMSINPMLNHQIPVKEFGFRKDMIQENPFKSDNYNLLLDLYKKSVVKHIPEALSLT